MSNRRQQLLSQLKNNLDIVSRAIGLDKSKASSTERPAEPAQLESTAFSSYNANKDQDFSANKIDPRVQGSNRAPPFPADQYSRNAAPNNGTAGIRDNIHAHQPSYRDQYSPYPERATLFPTSTHDIDSEDAFLYGSRLPEPQTHVQASSYSGGNSRQGANDNLMEKLSYLLQGGPASAQKLPPTSEEMLVDPFPQKDYPKTSVAGDMYGESRSTDYPSSAVSQDSDETVDRILKTIGLDGRISDMVQGLIRKDPRMARPSQALSHPVDADSLPNQNPSSSTNSIAHQINWEKATQQFLNKLSHPPAGETPRGHEIPFASHYPPPPNWNSQKESKLPDSSGGMETRLYFKARPEETALPGLNYRPNDSSSARALNETLSNIKAIEEALAGLNQSKTSLMLRPPGSQRDSMMLENMRMQEELSGQILALHETARDLSQQMKAQASSAPIQPPPESVAKKSPTPVPSQLSEERPREPSTSKLSDRASKDRKSRSRSHSRDRKRRRSRSRSHDRKRLRSRRYSRSRSRSRDSYRRRNRNRSRSRDRSRSRERRRSRERMLSDADRKALGFGTSVRKPIEVKTLAQKAEDKEKKALELALSMYVGASEYYNATNIWCQKCDVIFSDVFALCQHLHSEMHQAKVDPDYNKPRPPYVPVIPPGVPSAPSRGYEFILPLQAFFCSLCCEFSKDITKAEEHVKSVEHNNKFKQFVSDNSGYELKFLKDVMMAIARSKVPEEPQPSASKAETEVTDSKKSSAVFLKPEEDSKHDTREKFQIKFTGTLKQSGPKIAPRSPDVEVINVEPSKQKVVSSSDDTKKASGLAAASATANIIVTKMLGVAKKPPGKIELTRPPGWVLRADANVKPPAKNLLQNDKSKGSPLDIFSPDSPKTSSTPFSKFPPLPTGGKSTGGILRTTTLTTATTTGSAKKSEETVLNIGDFEIFDEC